MEINITLTEPDAELIAAFCSVTGWSEQSGVKAEDWVVSKIEEWAISRIRSGLAHLATKNEREAYAAAFKSAITSAASKASSTSVNPKPPAP